jgi:hypothetical protein
MNKLFRSLMLSGGLAAALTGSNFVPDAQKQSTASSSTTWAVNGCTFTVTYTWEGFKGRDLIASFGLYERMGTWDGSFNLTNVEGQVGKSGTLTHTFTLTANAKPGRNILARGSLSNGKTYSQISGSTSGTSSI